MFQNIQLPIIVLNPDLYEEDNNKVDGVWLPKYAYEGMSSAIDVRANINEKMVLRPNGKAVLISTGLKFDMPHHNCIFEEKIEDTGNTDGQFKKRYEFRLPYGLALSAMLLPRSGLGHKGLVVGNLVGLIDENYQGEVKISAWNRTQNDIIIQPREAIAQLMFTLAVRPTFVPYKEGTEFPKTTSRGENGYGSSTNNKDA